jgi:PAS domain S-box-containing protein
MNQASSVSDPVASEAYYRDLCDQLGMAVIATDAELNITLWNAAAGRLFGAASEPMRGSKVLSVFPLERRSIAERLLRRALGQGEGSEFEFDYRNGTGQRREYAATVAPILSPAGVRSGVSLCVRDITRRLGLQADLDESRKMAALGEMAGAVAHHFNNVLGGIVTSVDYANQSNDPAITRRVFEQVSRALMRTSSLVNGLLAFSEGGPHEDDLSDLTELLNGVADEMEFALAGRNIRLAVSIANVPVKPVPREQLMIVVRNIIQNAVEAMPDGGVLTIATRVEDEAIIFSISDTGKGMDENSISRMFEPFWTTKGALATVHGRAAGLGLSIAHGMIQRMGGSIRVRSEIGKGTTMDIRLPRGMEGDAS